MKKRRLLFTLLALLLVVGIPIGLLVREYRHAQANRALVAAVKASNTQKALEALNNGADPNTTEVDAKSSSPTALFLAFENTSWPGGLPPKNPELVHLLLDHEANPNIKGPDGRTPLMCAAFKEDVKGVHALLAHHADPNLRDNEGKSVLYYAFLLHSNPEVLRQLLAYGADVNAQDDTGSTPLMHATFDPDPASIQILLAEHAEINHRDARGHTALDWLQNTQKMQQRLLSRPMSAETLHYVSHADMEARLARMNATEQMLLEAGAKTSKELSSQSTTPPKH